MPSWSKPNGCSPDGANEAGPARAEPASSPQRPQLPVVPVVPSELPSAGVVLEPPAAPQLPLPLAAPQLAEPDEAVPLSLPLVVSEVAALLPPLPESLELEPPQAVRPRRAEAARASEVFVVLVMGTLGWSRREPPKPVRAARTTPTKGPQSHPDRRPLTSIRSRRPSARRAHSSVQSAPPSLKSRRRPVTVTEPAIALTSDCETSMSTGPTSRQYTVRMARPLSPPSSRTSTQPP